MGYPVESRIVEPSDDRLWLLVVAITDLLFGGVYALGGVANSPAQNLMKEIMPMPVWGVILVVAAGLLVGHWYLAGGILGGAVWCVFGVTTLISVLQNTAQSSGGPALLFGVAALHLVITHKTGLSARE